MDPPPALRGKRNGAGPVQELAGPVPGAGRLQTGPLRGAVPLDRGGNLPRSRLLLQCLQTHTRVIAGMRVCAGSQQYLASTMPERLFQQ